MGGAEVVIEGLNLLDGSVDFRDHALWLLEDGAPITTDAEGVSTLPYQLNPGFGDVIRPEGLGRFVRIGVRFGH